MLSSASYGRQYYVCAHGVSSLRCGEFFVSEPAICHPTPPHVSAVLPLRAHLHSICIDRATMGDNKGTFAIVIYTPINPHIYFLRGSISKNIPRVMFCVGIFQGFSPVMSGPADCVRRFSNLASRVGSSQGVFKISRDGSGRVRRFSKSRGLGRVTLTPLDP